MLRRQLNLKKYYMVLFVCIILIWLAYVYNFNKKSLALDEIPIESHSVEEKVEFQHNYSYGSYLDGYAIKVNDYQLIDTKEYLKKYNLNVDDFQNCPERVGLVNISIFNDGNYNGYEKPEGLLLDNLWLYGIDYYCNQNTDFYKLENPQLGDSNGIQLNEGEERNVVLVYNFFKKDFTAGNWMNMDKLKMAILLTAYPVQKEIVLQ